MTEHKIRSHRVPSRRRRFGRLATGSIALALVAGAFAVGTAFAGDGDPTGTNCVGGTPDPEGNLTLNCVVPMPPAVTVTVPVPGPTLTVPGPTFTETTTVTVTVPPSVSTTTVTVTPSPTRSPTTPPPTTPPATTPPPSTGWPTLANTGTPAGWVPKSTRTTDLIVTAAGTVVEDVRLVGASIVVRANNVTLRRVELAGGQVSNFACGTNLVVEDSSFLPPQGAARGGSPDGAITPGNYTTNRVKVLNRIEGLRSGGCGPVSVLSTYMEINDGGDCKLHADGIQGYYGRGLYVRDSWIDARKMTCGTAPFFYPRNQGNTAPVDIDGLWLAGGTMSLRLGIAGTVKNVRILDGSWQYAAVDVYCPAITAWQVSIVNAANTVVRAQTCSGDGT